MTEIRLVAMDEHDFEQAVATKVLSRSSWQDAITEEEANDILAGNKVTLNGVRGGGEWIEARMKLRAAFNPEGERPGQCPTCGSIGPEYAKRDGIAVDPSNCPDPFHNLEGESDSPFARPEVSQGYPLTPKEQSDVDRAVEDYSAEGESDD